MEDLVLSIEQCKHLQELGLDMSDAKLYWNRTGVRYNRETKKGEDLYSILPYKISIKNKDIIPTYTLQEILEKLPRGMSWDTWNWDLTQSGREFQYNDGDGFFPFRVQGKRLLETAYEALCWVIEKGYLNI